MKRLAVIPSDKIEDYLKQGYSPQWLRDYYNPCRLFDEVYLLSNLEKDQPDLLGMKVIHTRPREIAKRIKELNIDIVRAYGGNWACSYACGHKVPGVPVVVSVHDSNSRQLYGSIKDADIVLSMSKKVEELVGTAFGPKDRIWILPNRVDFKTMRPYPQDQVEDLDGQFPFAYKILHVGRLAKEKNLDTLIKALPLLGDEYGVVAVGHGDSTSYKKLAQELNVQLRVLFIDAVPNEELARYYSWCSCMCTPSRWEGFGMVFIEALACSSVVITSDIAPLNEYIVHGKNGLLVKDFENPQAIAQMVREGCNNGQLAAKLKGNARESVRIFEKETIEKREAAFYQKILEMQTQGEFSRMNEDGSFESYQKALAWVKEHTLPEQGIIVNTKERIPYLEVTGYFIPTLIHANEWGMARSYAEFLAYMQQPDGSYRGPDGKKYVFDTGQVLRGLLCAAEHWPEFKPAALKTADYILGQMEPSGRIHFVYEDNIPEYVQVFVLPALSEAGRKFGRTDFIEAAQKSISYYKKQPDVLSLKYLTHFLAYILDGFIDMGEGDFVRPFVEELFLVQRKDGRIRAYAGVNWTCSVGLAQLAIVGYKLGMRKAADLAMDYLGVIQNASGGFYGSYGIGAKYFPKTEISWANKFFLDAIHFQRMSPPNALIGGPGFAPSPDSRLLDEQEWHNAILAGQSVNGLAAKIKSNDFPVWCKPLLEHTKPDEVLLELGSGTGELAAICALYGRQMQMLDYSAESNTFAGQLFRELGLIGKFHCCDILQGVPLNTASVDWVYSSGVLEHFFDEQIIGILKESKRIGRKGVMSLVPNANAIFYRIGKHKMEQEGTWKYGHEDPKWTMRPLFEAAGLSNIQEYSIGTYHGLQFWGKSYEDIKYFFRQCSPEQLRLLNQGYLLFTMGRS